MRKLIVAFAIAVTLVEGISLSGQEQKEKSAASSSQPAAAVKPVPSAEELEARFKAMLTKATLSGRWTPIKEGEPGEQKEDKYQIVSVSKVSGDSWIVNAKLKYGDREFIAPLPVQVKWAGDAAVMIVDNLSMPGGKRSYSARVLFYDQTYSGTWSGGEHKGLLSGTIVNEKNETTSPAK